MHYTEMNHAYWVWTVITACDMLGASVAEDQAVLNMGGEL